MIESITDQRASEINKTSKKWRAVRSAATDEWTITRKPRHKRSFYDGGLQSRLTSDWDSIIRSSDEILRSQLKILIARSRELEINNQYVGGFLSQCEKNICGEKGIRLSMQVQEPDLKGGYHEDEEASQAIERAWKDYCKRDNFLVTQDMSQVAAQRLAVRSTVRDGGLIARKIIGKDSGNKYNFSMQLLEVDFLDSDYNETYGANQVRMGVEYNKFRKPVAYHLLTDHPGDFTYSKNGRKYIRLGADDIVHPFMKTRIGQTRGTPWLANSMAGLKMLLGYKEAELVAARAGAAIGNFFRDKDGVGDPLEDNSESSFDPESLEPMEPGMNQYIGSLEVVPNNPNHPSTAFGPFMDEALRGCAVGLGVAHHNFSGNMRGVNYSSARIAELGERDQWKILQAFFAEEWMQPIFAEWLKWALASGEIRMPDGSPLPLSKYDKFNQSIWRGRRWAWVDPLKEANAAIKRIDAKLESRRSVIEDSGGDEAEVYMDIAKGDKLVKELGLESEPESSPDEAGSPPSAKKKEEPKKTAGPESQDPEKKSDEDPEKPEAKPPASAPEKKEDPAEDPEQKPALKEDQMLIQVYGVGGTTALMDLIKQVAAGEVPRPQAKVILVEIFGLDDAIAEQLLPDTVKEPKQVDKEDV